MTRGVRKMTTKNLAVKIAAILLGSFIFGSAYAEEVKPVQPVAPTTSGGKDTIQQVTKTPIINDCTCLPGIIEKTKNAYSALEEEPWPVAIKATKTAIETITALSKTCKCPELPAYKDINDGYLKYAEAGEHLDSAEETNCTFATKKYSDANTLISNAILKVTNNEIATQAKTIKGYIEEEQQFVKDECAETTQKPQPPATKQ